jgi:hypothetical protein
MIIKLKSDHSSGNIYSVSKKFTMLISMRWKWSMQNYIYYTWPRTYIRHDMTYIIRYLKLSDLNCMRSCRKNIHCQTHSSWSKIDKIVTFCIHVPCIFMLPNINVPYIKMLLHVGYIHLYHVTSFKWYTSFLFLLLLVYFLTLLFVFSLQAISLAIMAYQGNFFLEISTINMFFMEKLMKL